MHGHDVFAVLTAYDQKNKASSAFKLSHNSTWFLPAIGGVAEVAIIGSREATPAQSPQLDEDACAADRLVVTFSELMQLENLADGIQAGTGTSSHILLGYRGTRGISHRQYNIAVDDQFHIWLHDYHSSHGTAVGYKGQNEEEMRRKETWILAYEPGRTNPFGNITINSGGLVVRIEFPNHGAADPQYVAHLRAFVDKCKDHVPTVQGLGLGSQASTQAPSGAQTIGERLIYYKEKRIGKGSFGQVYKLIRARDGKAFAAKIFTPPANRNKRRRDEVDPAWLRRIRDEFTIVKENPHHNVVQVFELQERPEPMIIMAYYPLGSMVDAGVFDEARFITSFGQILDCLGHLHRMGIVHRDLKPENFLVEFEPVYKVVLGDFGMAKVATDDAWLNTFCGTLKYASPEVFPFNTEGHGPPADVWSLGVIVLEWIHGIPTPPDYPTARARGQNIPSQTWRRWVEVWVDKLIQALKDEDDGQVVQILSRMLQPDDRKRWHAMDCLELGLRNGLFKRRVFDGLIACAADPEGTALSSIERGDYEPKKQTTVSPPRPTQADSGSKASTALENL